MPQPFYDQVASQLSDIRAEGLWKDERVLESPQGASVTVAGRSGPSVNFCANNYLGLASHERVIEGAVGAARRWGAGLASVRFICGTQEIHRELEATTADYLGFEDSISFAAAFDANGGVFEPFWGSATRSCRTASIMHRLSMESGCRRRSAIASPTAIWGRSKRLSRKRARTARKIS